MKRRFLRYPLPAIYCLIILAVSCSCGETPSPSPPSEVRKNIIYISPDGKGDGSSAEVPTTLRKALGQIKAGYTIYLKGGEYNLNSKISIADTQSGMTGALVKFYAYENEKPVLDFNSISQGVFTQGISMDASYWHFKGIEICNAPGDGMKVKGSYNIFENCIFHHNSGSGLSIGQDHGATNDGTIAAYNKVINCDSYLNFDWHTSSTTTPGTNADGFACKLASGRGNEFYGCRSWRNSDDGWDFYKCGYAVKVVNCWTWQNGSSYTDYVDMYQQKTGKTLTASLFSGDGNGFKAGGNNSTGESYGTHIFRNCISFGHTGTSGQGITQNAHKDGAVFENCLSYANNENYRFWEESVNSGKKFTFKNCISFDNRGRGDKFVGASEYTNNSWNLGLTGSANDYVSLLEENAKSPRNSDGSLPSGFGRLTPTSQFVGKGVAIPAYSLEGFSMDAVTSLNLGPQY